MAGSVLGNQFVISTWGESHGQALGVVVDGCPAGLELSAEDIQKFLDRRKPGQNQYSTPREEPDRVQILSGVFEGKTTGTPISLAVWNTSERSGDYQSIADIYRPGHADYTMDQKYGFRDYRGGGRSSGRETIGRAAAGAIAVKILGQLGISILTYTKSIGPVSISSENMNPEQMKESPLCMPDKKASEKAEDYLRRKMDEKDSSGGVIECVVSGVSPGIGEPVFAKLDAALAGNLFSVGAVKGVEIGEGFSAAGLSGSENNDGFFMDADGKIKKSSNHAGGILGGISDGSDIIIRAAFKPTPSISAEQKTVNKNGEEKIISIGGRHDPIIVPRAVVVVESMVAVTLTDQIFAGMTARMDKIKEFYK